MLITHKKPLITDADILEHMPFSTTKDEEYIQKACAFAIQKHAGQTRHSGLPYYTHTFEVGKIAAQLGLSTHVVAAAILHDTIEDTDTTEEELRKEFGKEVAFLVEGVSHLGEVRYQGLDIRVNSLQKLFIATSKDLRVILIKLSDRLHNMRTLKSVPEEKRQRIAKETQKVYVPIADRLGIGSIKKELEDLSFKFLHPDIYNKIKEKIEKLVGNTSLDRIEKTLSKKLAASHITHVTIASRIKGVYSTYKKMEYKKYDFEDVKDIIALRVILDDIPSVYTTFGIVHACWKPIPKTFKDYISYPKPNGYQALHTRVIVDNKVLEIQILTHEMQQHSEHGIAAHFAYKEKRAIAPGLDLSWFEKLLPKSKKNINASWIERLSSMYNDSVDDFLEDMETDFFQDRMFIYTPKGEVIDLPRKATVLDFAFAIHSDIGIHAEAGVINEKYSALNTELKNGDIVEVKTTKKAVPTMKWLGWVVTAEARTRIRNFLKKSSSLIV